MDKNGDNFCTQDIESVSLKAHTDLDTIRFKQVMDRFNSIDERMCSISEHVDALYVHVEKFNQTRARQKYNFVILYLSFILVGAFTASAAF